ncbi:MAG: VCBS repeat-containing protein [Planctomycetales bacterium]|nr:VCBS repeat-containing protein [Planctomycetales bacterium]
MVGQTRNCQFELLENRQLLTALNFAADASRVLVVNSDDRNGFIDFDGNSFPDIASTGGIWPGNGDGTFGELILNTDQHFKGNGYAFPGRVFGVDIIDIGDIDGDGDIDLASIYSDESANIRRGVQWHENLDGAGSEYRLRPIDFDVESLRSSFVALADLDGDSDLDIATNVAWYENDANGQSFKRHLFAESQGFVQLHAVADIDGDQDIDLITSRTGQIGWRENNGAGDFAAQRTIDGNLDTRPRAVRVFDMDGDGDRDLIAVDTELQTLGWYENYDGHGSFGRRQLIEIQPSLKGTAFVDVADVDLDGDVDILTGRGNRTQLILIEGLGPFDAGDSNRDGVFDSSDLVFVFQANEYEDALNGNSTFDEGDWNGDGDFNSSDFVYAFQRGKYVAASKSSVAAAIDDAFRDDDSRRAFVP